MLQNNQNSWKFTHTPMYQDLAVTLMDTPGYFLHLYIYLCMLLYLLSANPYKPIIPSNTHLIAIISK